jgi:hypothetical protein
MPIHLLRSMLPLLVAVVYAAGAMDQSPPPDKGPVGKLKLTELIDKLPDESSEGAGFHSTAWASGFMAIDEEPEFRGGILGSRKPTTSPVMRELVRRGVAALPDLLEHLTDKRPTRLTITHEGGFGGVWHSDEYYPRFADPKKQPPGVNTGLEKEFPVERGKGLTMSRKYVLRVGDLCFVAIGQIVNRSLSAVRYQPTMCLVFNSPVETPALAAAARSDWAGLTVEQHRQSLAVDAMSKYPYASAAAIKRLLFYYPQEGETVALKLLARPVFNGRPMWDFIDQRLMKSADPNEWKKQVDELRRTDGQPAVEQLPFRIHWMNWLTSREHPPAEQERAGKILAELFPRFDAHTPSFINAAEPSEQTELIAALAVTRSAKFDDAVYRVFQQNAILRADDNQGRYEQDQLAFTCMNRLKGQGHDEEFRAFAARRIVEWEKSPETDYQKNRLAAYRAWQERLK